jgi:hypothetical protein
MKLRLLVLAAGLAVMTVPLSANAGAIARGAKEGSAVGTRAAGPVGGAVGSVMGGAAYGFRSGASKVLGIPEETGSVQRHRSPHKKRTVRH